LSDLISSISGDDGSWDLVMSLLTDERVEVRQLASDTLAGLIRMQLSVGELRELVGDGESDGQMHERDEQRHQHGRRRQSPLVRRARPASAGTGLRQLLLHRGQLARRHQQCASTESCPSDGTATGQLPRASAQCARGRWHGGTVMDGNGVNIESSIQIFFIPNKFILNINRQIHLCPCWKHGRDSMML
jgi:hypothetical protein